MTLRIYSNPIAVNTHRNLVNNINKVEDSFEKISSGLKVNRAADAPASLVISEKIRSQIASIEQSVKNTETDISVLQTAESALDEINSNLVNIRQLSVHAANEGALDKAALEADQQEIDLSLQNIDRIARSTSFGAKKLLDGTSGAGGTSNNEMIDVVSATSKTKPTRVGYDVEVTEIATRATVIGSEELTEDTIAEGETLKIMENGKIAEYTTKEGDDFTTVIGKLNEAIQRNGLNVEVSTYDNEYLMVRHKEYGSEHAITVFSSTNGILSSDNDEIPLTVSGTDIKGFINQEAAIGRGLELRGGDGSDHIEGLTIRYNAHLSQLEESDFPQILGQVFIEQNALNFQTGPNHGNTTKLSIGSVNSDRLGRGIGNDSNFQHLKDINVTNHQKASDSMLVVDSALSEVNKLRAKIGAIQKHGLESNLRSLRISRENMISADSTIRDVDYAEEISNLAKNQILQNASMSVLSQNNSSLKSIVGLLGS